MIDGYFFSFFGARNTRSAIKTQNGKKHTRLFREISIKEFDRIVEM